MNPERGAFHVPISLKLRGEFDLAAFRNAVRDLIGRHEVLRTVYLERDGGAVQRIMPVPSELPWSFEDLSAAADPERLARERFDAELEAPFDLREELPLRVTVFKLDPSTHILLLLVHHIAIDEWTTGALVGELSELYAARRDSRVSLLSPSPVQYADYAIRQREQLEGPEHQAGLEHWRNHLSGAPSCIEWPMGKESSGARHPAETIRFRWDEETSRAVLEFAHTHQSSVFATLYGAFAAFIARITAQPDLTVGLSVPMRRPELRGLVGLLFNTIPMRSKVALEQSFETWIKATGENWQLAMTHHWIPIAEIEREARLGGEASEGPLFDTIFTFVSAEQRGRFAGLDAEPLSSVASPEAKVALRVSMREAGGVLSGEFEFDSGRFDSADIEQLATLFEAFALQCTARPRSSMFEHPLLAEKQREPLLLDWARGRTVDGVDTPVHELFEGYAAEAPDRVAVTLDGIRWTYADLNRRANRLANTLRAVGVGPGTTVGVEVERSPELIAALYGVLKAGGAYVALQPSLPDKRLAYMVKDAGVRVTLTDDLARSELGGLRLDVAAMTDSSISDANLELDVDLDDLAYVLYTSGSTGLPKGVMLSHRAVANLVGVIAEQYPEGPGDAILQKTPYSFDISVSEIFNPLAHGARLVMIHSGATKDPAYLRHTILNERVTVLRMTPTELGSLMETEGIEACGSVVRRVLACGEALTPAVCRKVYEKWPEVELINLWGPTEACVYASWWAFNAHHLESIPIGRPLPNYRLYSLDDTLEPTPVGMRGELFAGGPSLARGYHGLPGKTALAYRPDPHAAQLGARMYASGDLVSWNRGGNLEFHGRKDNQIQLRGMRIELGELESALEEHASVRLSAVRPISAADGRVEALVAYVVFNERHQPEVSELRAHLAEYVEESKIPSQFVVLDEMPLTPSGKIDRSGLSALVVKEKATDHDRTAARTATEKAVAKIWAERLGVEFVGIHANFFELGGHSLLAMRVQRDIAATLGMRISVAELAQHPTVAQIAAGLDTARAEVTAVTRFEGRDAPLSLEQLRLFFLQESSPSAVNYNEPLAVKFTGELNTEALRGAVNALVARHDALRSHFPPVGIEPVQRVTEQLEVSLDVQDVVDDVEARKLLRGELAKPFDLHAEVGWRVALVRVHSDASHILAFVFHHILLDQWTEQLLLDELAEQYRAIVEEEVPRLEPARQYADYAVWQRSLLHSDALAEGLTFWQEQLRGSRAVLDFPFDKPSGPDTAVSGRVRFRWPPALAEAVRHFASERQVGTFVVLNALFAAFLARVTGQREIAVGVAASTRDRPELQQIVGLLLNTLPVVLQSHPAASMSELVDAFSERWESSRAHQWVPLSEIVRSLGSDGTGTGAAPFDTMFTYVPGSDEDRDFGPAIARRFDYGISPESKASLSLLMGDEANTLVGSWEYDGARFERTTMEQQVARFERFVACCLRAPDAAVASHVLLPAEERERLLAVSDIRAEYPREATIQSRFEACVAVTPNAIALEFGEERLTYEELNRRSNRVANRLRRMGVGPGCCVGILMDRCVDLVVAILGTLKAGGAFVPLDPSYPVERLAFMLKDTGVRTLLTQRALESKLPAHACEILRLEEANGLLDELDENPSSETNASSLAYIMYTSGSTGRPKGVAVTHRGVVRLVQNNNFADLGPRQRHLLLAPISFDASTLEIWGPLLNGGQLVVAPPGQVTLEELGDLLQSREITALWLTAGLFHFMVDEQIDALTGVQQLYSGGDVLSVAHVERLLSKMKPGCRFHNGYGPTESTTFATCFRTDPVAGYQGSIPIGAPIANTSVFALDSVGELVPNGTIGELFIGGDGLAREYWCRPRNTAESFVPDLLSDQAGARMYRTGDLGLWNREVIEFRGRIDHQVKVRGFRIEPGEIEAALAEHPKVRDVLVVAVAGPASGDERLVGYVVPESGNDAPSPAQLREFLGGTLPEFMIPSEFITVDKFILGPTGKVDRKALPRPGAEVRSDAHVKPRTPTEEKIAAVWRQVLEREDIGVRDRFMEVGGHSLLALRLQRALELDTHRAIPLAKLLELQTVEELAVWIDSLAGDTREAIPRHTYGAEVAISFDQRRLWFLQQLRPDSVAYQVPIAVRLGGALDRDALISAVAGLVSRHEILRTIYPSHAGEPVQQVRPAGAEIQWTLDDVCGHDDAEQAARTLLRSAIEVPFDLERELPIRGMLVRLSEHEHVLMLLVHHIAIDEWSMGVCLSELSELYAAATEGRDNRLAPQTLQYADYALWQYEQVGNAAFSDGTRFWREQLEGAPRDIAWPMGKDATEQCGRASTVRFRWSEQTSDAFRETIAEVGSTPFIALYGAFAAYLARFTGQRDLTIGLPVTMRERPELQSIVGFLLNTIPMRSRLPSQVTLRDWLNETSDRWAESSPHRSIPLDAIVQAAGAGRGASPLFDTMFTYLPAVGVRHQWSGIEVESFEVGGLPEAKAAVVVVMSEADGRFLGTFEFDGDRFDFSTAHRFVRQFEQFVRSCLAAPERPLMDASVLDEGELATVVEWSAGAVVEGFPGSFPELFARQVARGPDRIALRFEDSTWTYEELDRRVRQLAYQLATLSMDPEHPVGVAVQRSDALVVSLLAVLRAGLVYVALEPGIPRERLLDMAENTGVRLVVCDAAGAKAFATTGIELLDSDAGAEGDGADTVFARVDPQQLAYILHTSGTTGRPKGVMIPHRALASHAYTYGRDLYGLDAEGAQRIFLNKASYTFDMFVAELFPALVWGAQVVIAPAGAERDPDRLMRTVGGQGVTDLWGTPTHLSMLVEGWNDGAGALRNVYFGGEALTAETWTVVQSAWPGVSFYNLYGPTEMCVGQTGRLVRDVLPGEVVSIGRAMPNCDVNVLDTMGHPTGRGVNGEVTISGMGESRGYANNPRQTARSFLPSPASSRAGMRMYCTGDRGHWGADGSIAFRGRNDEQVQVRGIRIELTEVESLLSAIPGVRQAAVRGVNQRTGRADGLVAYVVLDRGHELDVPAIRAHLSRQLAEAVIPSRVVQVDSMPTSPSGKLDRSALPDLSPNAATSGGAGKILPGNPTEQTIAEIWGKHLELNAVGIDEDFFEIGGHSLLAVRVMHEIRTTFEVDIEVSDLFDSRTVGGLAMRILVHAADDVGDDELEALLREFELE